jgi:hypothetical protein
MVRLKLPNHRNPSEALALRRGKAHSSSAMTVIPPKNTNA